MNHTKQGPTVLTHLATVDTFSDTCQKRIMIPANSVTNLNDNQWANLLWNLLHNGNGPTLFTCYHFQVWDQKVENTDNKKPSTEKVLKMCPYVLHSLGGKVSSKEIKNAPVWTLFGILPSSVGQVTRSWKPIIN